MNEDITNWLLLQSRYNALVIELVHHRKESSSTQTHVAERLNVSYKRVNEFENLKIFDMKLLCDYAEFMSIEIDFNFYNKIYDTK